MKFVYFKGMGQPDFRAFAKFLQAEGSGQIVTTVPRSERGETSNYMHIDLSAYANATQSARTAAQESVQRQLVEGGATQETQLLYRDMLEAATQEAGLRDSGGGGAYLRGIIMTDNRSINQSAEITDVLQRDVTGDMSQHNRFATEKVRRHEAAHEMLGLEEAGSDFVAAATMLRDHPESRAMWRNEADLRLVYGLQRGVESLSKYGVECHDAIERALAMSPQELRSASLQTLHAIGLEFDQKNAMNLSLGANSPEGRILATIAEQTGHGLYKNLLKDQWGAAVRGEPPAKNVMEQLRYTASTPEAMLLALDRAPPADREGRRIATDLRESIERLNQYTIEAPTPAPQPKAAPASATP